MIVVYFRWFEVQRLLLSADNGRINSCALVKCLRYWWCIFNTLAEGNPNGQDRDLRSLMMSSILLSKIASFSGYSASFPLMVWVFGHMGAVINLGPRLLRSPYLDSFTFLTRLLGRRFLTLASYWVGMPQALYRMNRAPSIFRNKNS